MARVKKLTDSTYSPTIAASEEAIRTQIDDSIQEAHDLALEDVTINRKLSATGDFTGTINGGDVTLTEPGLSGAFNAHLAEMASEEALGHVKVPAENIGETGLLIFPTEMGNISSFIVGDGIADDTDGMLLAVADCIAKGVGLYLPSNKIVRIASEIDFTGINNISLMGKIIVDCPAGNGIVIGHTSLSVQPLKAYVDRVESGASIGAGVNHVRIQGTKNGYITLMQSPLMQVYGDGNIASIGSTAYSYFFLGNVYTLDIYGINGGWINRNTFHRGRVTTINIRGDYGHNDNFFDSMDLENVDINIDSGSSNTFWNARLEGTNTIDLAAGTHSNRVYQAWNSISRSPYKGTAAQTINATVTDLGNNPTMVRLDQLSQGRTTILDLNKDSKLFNSVSDIKGVSNIEGGLSKLKATTGTVFMSDYIPALKDLYFLINSDADMWRYKFHIFNSAKAPITGVDPGAISTTSLLWNAAGYYTRSSDADNMLMLVTGCADLAYVRLEITNGSGGLFDYLTIDAYERFDEHITRRLAYNKKSKPIAVSASPTTGFAQVGEIVAKTDGTLFVSKKSIEQTLASTAALGATSVTVADATGIADGDRVGILLDDGSTNWRAVAGLSGTTFNVTALTGQASAGNRIVFNLWGAITT
jgi:hypothetical protein